MMDQVSIAEVVEYGRDAGRGNLLGVQPCVSERDYASAEALKAKLDGYLKAAEGRGWLWERTIVALPEYVGTWLAASGEGRSVRQAATLDGAMRALALNHPLRFLAAWRRSGERDKLAAGLFRMQAERMAGGYQAVFSRLARAHGVTIVAGSIILPYPRVEDGQVRAGAGPLQSVSAVFGPDGRAHGALVRKVYPTRAEQPMFAGAASSDLPVFDTAAGRLGVLICADAWYPGPFARLKAQGATLVVVPSAIIPGDVWHKPWGGYDGAEAPADVDPGDVGRLTEGQACHKYALAGRIGEAGAEAGLNVFLRGSLWDTSTDGYSLAIAGGRIVAETRADGAALLNVWL